MSAYLIAEVDLTDDAWVPGYASVVHDIVAKHGGKYLSRSGNIEILEGEHAPTTLIATATVMASDRVRINCSRLGSRPEA